MKTLPTVLVVADEIRSLESIQRILENDFDVMIAATATAATEILQREWVQILICDQQMSATTEFEFLKQVRTKWPDVIRMVISDQTNSEDIVSAINEAGIYQYITKPWHPQNLLLNVKNGAHMHALQRQNEALSIELKMMPEQFDESLRRRRDALQNNYQCEDGIVRTTNSCMNVVCDKIRRIAPYDISVLLCGESGTGKELAARALHYNSLRWDKPFVVENCGALPDELLESELFGYKRGAFTGAVEDRIGLFERATGGTVFLDEIGEVSPAFQVKLLRVLQEEEIRPLGSGHTRKVDVRIIAASNKDLEVEVHAGRFREDLYYRLAAVTIYMPPLRKRQEDIPLLANILLKTAMQNLGKRVAGFSKEAMDYLQAYHWPGNVRELQNEIHRMLVMTNDDELGADLLSSRVLHTTPDGETPTVEHIAGVQGTLKDRVDALEERVLREAMVRHRWNKSRAARELGLSRVGLRSKLERYGLERYVSEPKRAKRAASEL